MRTLRETFVVEKLVEQIIEEAPMPIEEVPETEPETIPKVEEVEIVVVEEPEIVDIVNVKPEKKGPRKAQTVKRRKAIRTKPPTDRETKLAGLSAVNKTKLIGELPSTKPLPKTAIGAGNEGKFNTIPKRISSEISDAVRQDPSQKKHKLPATKLGPKTAHRVKKKASQESSKSSCCSWD